MAVDITNPRRAPGSFQERCRGFTLRADPDGLLLDFGVGPECRTGWLRKPSDIR